MKLIEVLIMIVIFGLAAGCGGGSSTPAPDPMVLIKNEKAFAASVAEIGVRDGFLKFIADDGILFVPEAANGKEYYEASEQVGGILTWRPIFAEISGSGDLGWTTGPWIYRFKVNNKGREIYGQYNTIWKKQPDSTWKFVLDIGISHGQPTTEVKPLVTLIASNPDNNKIDIDAAKGDLLKMENEFSLECSTTGLSEAYRGKLSDHARLCFQGEFPYLGRDEILKKLSNVSGNYAWTVKAVDISSDASLGYAYGVSQLVSESDTTKFSYVHMWTRDKDGRWKLALDVQTPIPRAKKSP